MIFVAVLSAGVYNLAGKSYGMAYGARDITGRSNTISNIQQIIYHVAAYTVLNFDKWSLLKVTYISRRRVPSSHPRAA